MARFLKLLITIVASFGLFMGCGEQDSTTVKRTQDGGSSDATNGTKKGNPKVGKGDSGSADDGSDAGSDGATDDDVDDDGGNDEIGGLNFFEKTVLPVFQAQCVSCHTDPGLPSSMPAPFTIYSYNLMKAKLGGTTAKDNPLINKMMNKTTHSGGDRCAGGVSASPCKEVSQWWDLEFGGSDGDGGGSAAGLTGRIFEVTPLGKIIGWAYDVDDTTKHIDVVFYIDGPPGSGTKIGPTIANRGGADNNTPGDHAFLFDVPTQFRDKKKHTIRAYAVVDGVEIALGSESYEFTAYALSEAGRNFYNQNVANQVSGCGGCHVLSYEQHFYALVSPAPSAGGSATNNVLINKAGTRNGTSHGGGNRCGGGQPCTVFQQWWQIEFGN